VGEPIVHTYRAAEAGLWLNSYLVETAAGVLVFDASLLVSDIEALRARLAALKKPLLGVFVTHSHPDHFNGVWALVQDKEVPVYAAGSVGRVIEEIAGAKRAQWSPASRAMVARVRNRVAGGNLLPRIWAPMTQKEGEL
jgi:glyoxylase-like metal-dependent hydrolase (beta-lactamase superfamily II)